MPLESFASVLILCLLCAECWKGLAMRRHFLFSVVKVVEATWVQFRYHGENNCSKNNQIIISTERVALRWSYARFMDTRTHSRLR